MKPVRSLVRSSVGIAATGAILLAVGCTPSTPTTTGTGGRTAGSGGSTSSSGGSQGSSGGVTGSGGTPFSSGGATGTGGSGSGGSGSGTGGAASGGTGTGGGNGGGTGTGGGANTGGSGGGTASGGTSGNQDAGMDASVADVVVRDGSTTDGGAYTRTGWTAVYSCATPPCPAQSSADTGDVIANAFNGNFRDRWSTGQYQNTLKNQFPLTFTIDMKQVMNVGKVTMHPGCKDIFDLPGTYEVYLSLDGTDFGTAVVTNHHPAVPANGETCPPTATAVATDVVTFPSAPARFIQLKATQTLQTVHAGSADRYWAIGELNVYP